MTTPDPDSPLPEPAPVPAKGVSARPGAVTGAAVIAFTLAACEVILALLAVASSSAVGGPTALWYVIGLLHVVLAALLVWGGVQALRGRSEKILVFTSAAAAIVILVASIIRIFSGALPRELLFLFLYGIIVYALTRPQSKQFFAANGGAIA